MKYLISVFSDIVQKLSKGIKSLANLLALLVILSILFGFIISFIYTPPTLSKSRLITYNQCIVFFNRHPEYKRIDILNYNDIVIDNEGRFFTDDQRSREKLAKYFKQDEIEFITDLSKKLKKAGCSKAQKIDSVYLFITYNGLISPTPPGALYMSDIKDPNKINNENINQYKPFIRINDKWYFSRALVANWNRKSDAPISKSLFDFAASDYALKQ